MEDMLEAQEGLNRELNTLKSKLRWEIHFCFLVKSEMKFQFSAFI
jgi:hypothetical protein